MRPGGSAAADVGGMARLWDDTNFIVDGKPSQPGAEGGFDLDLATAEGLYREAVSLANDLAQIMIEADRLCETQPPADDPASVSFNNAGVEAFKAGAAHIQAEVEYFRSLARALGKALGVYQESDEQAGRDIFASGDEAKSGGGYI
ncbi:hypothetical protein SAXI111661_03445 [Saccharomonospora xinjiangensis]|uniref:PE domain-containing protein n=1 Tax=Saccharomonospora xinjiangensis XJ-54 TaxID=882086 RepID=I0UYH3_9PSEU|nr:hypothetical protein [Saccharomonospora xinjiangensis]EID52926.1 hypothetical protein SacxiDRAFT_0656 [Saccharomonospora xinjiangensis XJ-54]QBQ59781.1 hypothetical protein EYD13_07075 [Saccharomonospora xinjiangensis]